MIAVLQPARLANSYLVRLDLSESQVPAVAGPRTQPDSPVNITLHPRAGQIHVESLAMPPTPVINKEIALARMGGDQQLLGQLAEFFMVDAPALLRELETALANDDAAGVHHAAHSLKGLGANFEASGLVSTARQIEVLGKHGDLTGCQSLAVQLRDEHDQVIDALKTMLAQNGHPRG